MRKKGSNGVDSSTGANTGSADEKKDIMNESQTQTGLTITDFENDGEDTEETDENTEDAIKPNDICSICGRRRDDVRFMYKGEFGGYICDDCVDHLYQCNIDIKNRINTNEAAENGMIVPVIGSSDFTMPTPHQIKEYLDEYVIGQDEAKKTLAVAVYNHYKRILQPQSDNDAVDIEKSNILMLGPTGCGKTMLAKTVAKMLNVPFTIVDSTVFTEAGYVGEDVESILTRLLQACDYNVEKAEMGVCYLDEADKMCKKSAGSSVTRDVNGEGVQQAMLKLLEGTDVLVPPQGGRKHPEAPMVKINTKNILFICGGAFVGIEDIIKSRMNSNSVGFNLSDAARTKTDKDQLVRYVEPKDIREFGFIPEMIGRLPVITYVEKLDKVTLKRILTEPKNAIIKQYTKLMEMDGAELVITDEVYEYIVNEAMKNETGARGLRTIVEKIMKNIMYDIPTTKMKKVTIDAKYIKSIDPKYKFEEPAVPKKRRR